MDKNIINTIGFLIQFAVRIYTLYYTFRYNSALYTGKKQNQRTSRPRCTEQNNDHVGLKTTQISLEKIILRDFEYHQSIPYKFFCENIYTLLYFQSQQYPVKWKQAVHALIIDSISIKKEEEKGVGDVKKKSNSSNNNNLRRKI